MGQNPSKSARFQEAMEKNNQGLVLMKQGGDFEKARNHFLDAMTLFRELGREELALLAKGNLGRLLSLHGQFKKARILLLELLKSKSLSPLSRREALLTLTEVYRREGKPVKALQSLEQALPLLRKGGAEKRLRFARLSLVILQREAGWNGEALKSLWKFLEEVGGIPGLSPKERAYLIPILGRRLAGYDLETLFEEAKRLERLGKSHTAASLYLVSFDRLLGRKEFAKAKKYLSKARTCLKLVGASPLNKTLLLKEASLLLAQGKSQKVRSLLLPLLSAPSGNRDRVFALTLCSRADRIQGDFRRAAQGFLEVGRWYEKGGMIPQALRFFCISALAFVDAGLPEKAIPLAKHADFLLPFARGKARNPGLSKQTNKLLDRLYRTWIRYLLNPNKEIKGAEELAFALADRRRQGTLIADSLEGLPRAKQLERVRRMLENGGLGLSRKPLERIARDLRGKRQSYSFPDAIPRNLQAHLPRGGILLSFSFQKGRERCWLVNGKSFFSYHPSHPRKLRRDLQLWGRFISAYPGEGSSFVLKALGRRLSNELFGPLSNMIIKAQDILLVGDSDQEVQISRGVLACLFLDGSLSLPRIRSLPCAASLLVQFPEKKFEGALLVHHPELEILPSLLKELPSSLGKIKVCEGRLPSFPVRPLKLFYLGAHGRNRRGRLSLDLGSQVLTIRSLQFPSPQLVHLAACSSLKEEASCFSMQESFAKDFLSQGSQFVLGTAWEVEDRTVQAFDREFYRAWPKMSVPQAFQHAVETLRNRKGFSQPFQWATFCLYALR